MVSIEEGLYGFLKVQPEIAAIIGEGEFARIFPGKMPQDTNLPAIVYTKISGVREISHGDGGQNSGNSHLAHPRFQFTCWGKEYLTAKQLAQKLLKVLHAFNGVMVDVPVQSVIVENELDDLDDETNLFSTIIDATIWHQEMIT